MYAIVEIKGKQYKVEKGKEIYVDLMDSEPGSSVTIKEVLFLNDGNTVKIGQPFVEGSSVSLKVEKEVKGDKLVVFKFKRKKSFRWKKGHRQHYTKLTVEDIKN